MKSIAEIQAEAQAQSARQKPIDQSKINNAQNATYRDPYSSTYGGTSSAFMGPGYQAYQDALSKDRVAQMKSSAVWDANKQASDNQAAINSMDPASNPAAAMNRIVGIGDQQYQNSMNDPVDAMLMDELQSRISGQKNPYDATTINALQVGAANQGAAAEMANNAQTQERLDARGFNPSDPSYQAAMRQNQQQRQMGNQAANLSINQNANVANSGFQMQALGQANAQRGRQQSNQLAAGQMATNALNQVSSADANNNNQAWKKLPSWSAYKAQG
jgi:hypothetical protein